MKAQALTDGWRLKQLAPAEQLRPDILEEAARGASGDDWLPVPAMPATVRDVLLHHGVIEMP